MLRARLLSAVVLMPVVIGLIYVGGVPWLAGVLLAGIVAWGEICQLLQQAHFTVDRNLGYFFIVGVVLEAYTQSSGLLPFSLLPPLLAGLIIFSLVWALYNKGEHPAVDWGLTVASALYLGVLLSYFVTLREFHLGAPDVSWVSLPTSAANALGFAWLLAAFGMAWAYDSTAYFVGSAFGKHKLWPRISPKKSWEGLAGGSAGAMIAGVLFGTYLLGIGPWLGLLLGVLVATVDPFGDFAVSLFKRTANSKDSGHLIPGHGGLLDRMDSLLFIVPVVTYFAYVVTKAFLRFL